MAMISQELQDTVKAWAHRVLARIEQADPSRLDDTDVADLVAEINAAVAADPTPPDNTAPLAG